MGVGQKCWPTKHLTWFHISSIRVSLTLSCPMNLKLYPLDRQMCPMQIASCEWIWYKSIVCWVSQFAWLEKTSCPCATFIEPQMGGPLMTLSTFGRSKTLSRLACNWRQKIMLKSNSIVPKLHIWLNITHSHTISHIHHTYHCNS